MTPPPRSRWLLPEIDDSQARRLSAALDIALPAARILVGRGYAGVDEARRFLRPSLDELHDPFLLLGMRETLARLRRAIGSQEKILLYGDYDVDGTTSVVILKTAIELAGGKASWFVPNRMKDGYGIRTEAVDKAVADGVKLLISLDTGIRAAEAVCHARRQGLDVIVTDHHLPDATLPPALAVLNPKQPGCPYPDKNLCGAGVAFKLVQALLGTLGWTPEKQRRMLSSFLKLVAIGTVADVVPLVGENRIFVKYGLDGLRDVKSTGLRELMRVAGCEEGKALSASQVAYRIAPRMNAAGRMEDANDVVRLLLTQDADMARQIAAQLHALNAERQATEQEIVKAILDECLRVPITEQQAALVFAGTGWHRGVVGIVANRLMERFHRPVIVLSQDADGGVLQGSGRSVVSFHLLEALESMAELFLRFGGHRQAAGLALPAARLPEFRDRLNDYAAARLTPEDFLTQVSVDAEVSLADINERAANEVFALAPFGCGNPVPVLAVRGVEPAGPPALMKEKHLRVAMKQNGRTVTFKGWDFAGRIEEFAPGSRLDIAFCLEEDNYSAGRGYPGWCAVLKDVRPAVG